MDYMNFEVRFAAFFSLIALAGALSISDILRERCQNNMRIVKASVIIIGLGAIIGLGLLLTTFLPVSLFSNRA
jgi:hypothetical protein